MSWFFGGSNSSSSSPSKDDSDSYDTPSPYQEHAYDNHTEFIPQQQYSTSSGTSNGLSSGLGGGLGGNNNDVQRLREQLLAEQQKLLIQQIMFNLTDSAFESCIQKPSSTLSSSEKSCIAAIASKYLETSEFVRRKIESANK